jgi:hypothetical protein
MTSMRFGVKTAVTVVAVIAATLGTVDRAAGAARQRTFESADAAAAALVDAAKAGDPKALLAIFGPDGAAIVSSGDPVADGHARERFVERAAEGTHLERVGDDFAVLSVGEDDWPFPIPLIAENGAWSFDTAAGKQEILNRRIGRNELHTIHVLQEYVAAQRDYARRLAAAGGTAEYARRLHSTAGKHDGLYWEASSDEDVSPIGPLMAQATAEGYAGSKARGEPFHGYQFRILSMQGPDAPGGKKSYVRDGKMTEGFALVAYPAVYGSTGIMAFIVNEYGIVFQKDLGPRTVALAPAMTAYDPDATWTPVD